jgi:hypothetical protein
MAKQAVADLLPRTNALIDLEENLLPGSLDVGTSSVSAMSTTDEISTFTSQLFVRFTRLIPDAILLAARRT